MSDLTQQLLGFSNDDLSELSGKLLSGAQDVGAGALGLLGNVGEAYLAAKAPAAYYGMSRARSREADRQERERNYQRDQQARNQWASGMTRLRGREAKNLAPDAFNDEEARVAQQYGHEQVYQQEYTPDWVDAAQYMATAPDPSYRTAGAGMMRDQFQPGEDGAVNFNQYQGFDQQQRASFDQFKGRTPDQLNGMSVKDRGSMENVLRDDYRNESKAFGTVKSSYDRIQSSMDSGIGDVSMIFSFMKMLDPTSVVREGEFATAQNTSGIPDYVLNLYNQAVDGRMLPPNARQQIMQQSGAFFSQAASENSTLRARYINNANDLGVNPLNVVGGHRLLYSLNRHQHPPLDGKMSSLGW